MNSFKRIYNLSLSGDKEFVRNLRDILGFTPANIALFKLAFYHKSTPAQGQPEALNNNERLEFLGDALLSSIVAEYLFKKYPHGNEGFLTKMRSKIVKRDTLNEVGEKMGLDFILKELNPTRISKSMLGNALEALIGAIYVELGHDKTRKFVVSKILRNFLNIHELETWDDNYKSQLLEWCQKHNKNVDFVLLDKLKQSKRDFFRVAIVIDGIQLTEAQNFNKKAAEQLAAEKALPFLPKFLEDHPSTPVSEVTVSLPADDEAIINQLIEES